MSSCYSIKGVRAVTTTDKTLLGLTGSTSKRLFVYDVVVGCAGAPQDAQLLFILQRYSAAGTPGSAVTPQKLDMANGASTATAGEGTYAVEPTYTSAEILLNLPTSQRTPQRWWATPGGEIVVPATSGAGVGIQTSHASYSNNAGAMVHFRE